MHYRKYGVIVTMLSVLVGGFLCANASIQYLSDLPASKVVEIHRYLSDVKNRQKNDPSALETRYSWQHMSEFYPVAQIKRSGDIKPLPKAIDKT